MSPPQDQRAQAAQRGVDRETMTIVVVCSFKPTGLGSVVASHSGHMTSPAWSKLPERLADGLDPYPVEAHLLDTATVAGAVWDVWLSERLRGLIARSLGVPAGQARAWVSLAAGLHDIGKVNPVFQQQVRNPRSLPWRQAQIDRLSAAGLGRPGVGVPEYVRSDGGRIAGRHEFVSYTALTGDVITRRSVPDLSTRWLPVSAAGHHGTFAMPADDGLIVDVTKSLCGDGYGREQDDIVGVVAGALGVHPDDAPSLRCDVGVAATLISGFVTLCDWLASSDDVVQAGLALVAEDVAWSDWPAAREAELRDLVARTFGSFRAPGDALSAILGTDADGNPHSPRPLQGDVVQGRVGEGLWLVAYPTGEGKTEAALLRHVLDVDEGLIFGLPTQATTNAMSHRLRRTLGASGNSVVLSHQFAAAHDVHCASEYGLDWFSTSTRRLVAPVVAATCDQVLVGALRQRFVALRLLALANHHVVLDEVHTYDRYQSELLTDLLPFLGACQAPVTVLSATMPLEQQQAIVEAYQGTTSNVPTAAQYPAHRYYPADGGPSSPLTPPLSAEQPDLCFDMVGTTDPVAVHVRWVLDAHRLHPACHLAVVVSTVGRAISTAQAVSDALARAGSTGIDVVVLHSRMTLEHRTRVEAELERRLGKDSPPGRPVVVVATQVVEASLDIDFDLMSSDVAPAASLVQRAGRQWRFRDGAARAARFGFEPIRRVMRLIVPVGEDEQITYGSALPYLAPELRRVQEWVQAHPVVRVPQDVQAFVDETVFDLSDPSADVAETAAAIQRLTAASESKARLADVVRRGRYRHLHVASTPPTDPLTGEELRDETRMRTRFIEDPTRTYVLLGQGHHPGPVDDLAQGRGAGILRSALNHSIQVGGRLDEVLAAAHQETLASAGTAEWSPRSAALRFLHPINVAHLPPDVRYDPHLGLVAGPPSRSTT